MVLVPPLARQELLCYQLAHRGRSHGHSWQRSWKSEGDRWHPGCAPAVPSAGAGEWAWSCMQGTCFADGSSAAGRVVKLLGSC